MLACAKKITLPLLFAATLSFAQTYHVQSITTEDGLVSNQVNSVVQDDTGLLWISTAKGLARYDGLYWYPLPDSLPVPTNTDTRLLKLPDGRIFMAGHSMDNEFMGVVFTGSSAEVIKFSLENAGKKIWTVTNNNGNIFLHVSFQGIMHTYSFSQKHWESFALPPNLADNVNALRGFENDLYLLSKVGIYKVIGTSLERITPATSADVTIDVQDIVKTDSAFYVLGRRWLGKLVDDRLTIMINDSDREGTIFNNLRLSESGLLFFRSERKFIRYHIPTGDYVRFAADNDDAIPQNSSLYIDGEQNLWITSYRGLHKLGSFQFLGFTPNSGLYEYEVSSIAEIAPGKYFIGGQRSYAIVENHNIMYRGITSENPQARTRMISVTKKVKGNSQQIYVAGQELGVGELQANGTLKWSKMSAFGGAEMVAYLNDTVFVSNPRGAMFTYHQGIFKPYLEISGYARNMYLLEDGTKLICTSSGLRIIRGKSVEIISVQNNVLLRSVYCMFKHDGDYYLGTDAGIAIYRDGQVQAATLFGRSITNPVYAVSQISENEFWFGSDIGVIVVKDSSVAYLNDIDGLLGTEINRRAFIRSSTGDMLIGTNKGLNIFDSNMSNPRKQVFPPEILYLEVGNDSIGFPWVTLELAPKNNNLRINFRSVTFGDSPVSFKYRMLGFDEEWSELSSRDTRQVQYRSLPPGTYQFELSSRIGDGPWSESVISPEILLRRPFYTSWPFFVLLFMLAVGAGFVVNRIATQFTINKKLKETIQVKIKEIELNEAKLQLALENSRMGVWTYNFETKRVEHTHQIFEILQMNGRKAPMNAPYYANLVHPDERIRLTEELAAAVQSKQSFENELRLKVSNHTYRWVSVKGRCLYHENGNPYMLSGTLTDINDRKEYESDREKLITELEQTNRELDRFVYSASHDLSAPMKSVMGLINLARMNATPAEIQNYLQLIDKSIRKQDEFIKEIISFARNTRTQVQIEPIDLTEIVEEILSNLKYTDQYSKSEFSIAIADNSRVIPCDRTRLKIILNNLLSNAIKFQRKDIDTHLVTVTASRVMDLYQIKIEDNGEGIRSEHRERIFDMFYRATDNAPGSGLGLYIAKEAAEKMGGRIDVESTFGKGSKFTITLSNNGHTHLTSGKPGQRPIE